MNLLLVSVFEFHITHLETESPHILRVGGPLRASDSLRAGGIGAYPVKQRIYWRQMDAPTRRVVVGV